MRALILVAGAALALSACTTLRTNTAAQDVDLGCQIAVLSAQTTGEVANIAQQHGYDPMKAAKLADAAAKGEDVTRAICAIASVFTLKQ